jgi:hypothetical protein
MKYGVVGLEPVLGKRGFQPARPAELRRRSSATSRPRCAPPKDLRTTNSPH